MPHRASLVFGLFCLLLTGCLAQPAAPGPAGGRRPLNLKVNGRWIGNGVSFSPYRDGQEPGKAVPSDDEIVADLRLVARYWTFIRVYDTGAVTERTLKLIRQDKLPMRVVLGAWISPESSEENKARNRTESEGAIRLANAFPDIVVAVNVGNETCVGWSGHHSGPEVLIPWLRMVRNAIRQPVTTADDYSFWNREDARPVVAEVDFIMLHAYALWNSRKLAESMEWTIGIYDSIVRLYPGVPVIFGETGWATKHDPKNLSPGGEGIKVKDEVSDRAQEFYLRRHYDWVEKNKVPTLLFEAFDENWKGGGAASSPDNAEKHWGVFTTDRKPKASFEAIIRDYYKR